VERAVAVATQDPKFRPLMGSICNAHPGVRLSGALSTPRGVHLEHSDPSSSANVQKFRPLMGSIWNDSLILTFDLTSRFRPLMGSIWNSSTRCDGPARRPFDPSWGPSGTMRCLVGRGHKPGGQRVGVPSTSDTQSVPWGLMELVVRRRPLAGRRWDGSRPCWGRLGGGSRLVERPMTETRSSPAGGRCQSDSRRGRAGPNGTSTATAL
jgi:hypothetical protein